MIRLETRRFSDLMAEEFELWRKWIATNPACRSPFLHPEFARAVHECEHNVEVIVARERDQVRGLLPFQRIRGFSAIPVGGYLSDHQGWISAEGYHFDLAQLPHTTDISSFRFHMLPLDEHHSLGNSAVQHSVVYADLSSGFEGYVMRKKELGSNLISKLGQKERKLAKEIGPLQYQEGFNDEGFENLLQWKSIACKKRNVWNSLASSHARETLLRLAEVHDQDFRCYFSTLNAGGEMIAAHFGLICHDRLSAWLPAYNPKYHRYSPGLLILFRLIRDAERNGISRIDFGSGELDFKDRFMTNRTTMLEGLVDKNAINRFIHFCWLHAKRKVKTSPFQRSLQSIWYYSSLALRD